MHNSDTTISVNYSMNIVKCLAILSVIMAHARGVDYPFVNIVTERLGALGVIAFLIVAGYYYNMEKYGVLPFFKNKIKTIVIPWVFTGTLVYAIGLKFDFFDWFLWIIGYKTYLYYLTTIMLCFLTFAIFPGKKMLWFFIIINILSLLLTSFGIFDQIGSQLFGTPFELYNYLNIFNWIGFFALGILLKSKMQTLFRFALHFRVVIIAVYLILLSTSVFIEPNVGGYFSKLAIPLELAGILCMFSIATFGFFQKLPINKIAELSFGVYLIHFLTFPIRRWVMFHPIMDFINPFLILGLSCFALWIGLKVAEKVNSSEIYCTLLGIRDNKK